MPNATVSASSRFWRLVIGLLIGAQLIVSAIATFRIQETYALRRELNAYKTTVDDLKAVVALEREEATKRQEANLELFGETLMKSTQKPPPSRLEQWLINRDKVFRDRQSNFERRLLALENK